MKFVYKFYGSFLFVFSILFIFLFQSFANADSCSYFHENTVGLSYYRQVLETGSCYMDINPVKTDKLIYRSYLLSHNGLFMVFNSYSENEGPGTSGARIYYLFPRSQIPDRKLEGNNLVILTSAPWAKLHFNSTTARLESISNGQIKEDPIVNPTNKGGIEFSKNTAGLVLDVGFAMDKDASLEKERVVFFRDQYSKICKVKNREIFNYPGDDVQFKFKTDPELKKFLKTRCPSLSSAW